MLPNVAETRDPLNPDLLPASAARMELNYRTTTAHDAMPPVWLFLSASLLAAGSLFVTRLLMQLQPPTLIFALLGGVALAVLVLAVFTWRRGRAAAALFCAAAAPVLVLVLSTNSRPLAALAACLFAFAMAVWLSVSIVHHTAAWHSANLRVALPIRKRVLAVWNPANLYRLYRSDGEGRSDVRAREGGERNAFRRWLLTIFIALAAGSLVQVFASHSRASSLGIALVLMSILAAVGVRNVASYCERTGCSMREAITHLRCAFCIWFGYNQHGTLAPGVMTSPVGPCATRTAMFILVFVASCCATSLSCYYFAFPQQRIGDVIAQRLALRRVHALAKYGPPMQTGFANPVFSLITLAEGTTRRLVRLPEGRILAELLTDIPRQWSLTVFAMIACSLVPPVVFALQIFALSGRVLVHLGYRFRPGSPYLREISEWDAAVDRLRQSHDQLETEHVWLGVAVETDSPVLMHRQLAAEHVHLMGSTGSNKTSIGVTQLLQQLIGPDSSLLILDLKGDMALFESARLSATSARDRHGDPRPIRFRWFTTETDRSTYVFNPLCQSYLSGLPRLERTEILSKCLGLEHGEGYGRGHFSLQNRNALLKLLSACPEVDSFRKLHEEGRRQKKLFTSWEREHASDFFSVIHTLANIDALNLSRRDRAEPEVFDQAIDMIDLIREPNIVYFRLPATSQSAANREVGKMAIHSLLTAVRQAGRPQRQIFIVIDEFQQLVSVDLAIVLQQARSYGIGVIMAHQTQSDLQLPEANMMQVVEENTHFKQIFSVNDLEHRQALEKLSGEASYHKASWQQTYETYLEGLFEPNAGLPSDEKLEGADLATVSTEIGPRLRANDLIAMSARQNVCMVQFKRSVGYGQYDGFPFLVRTDYHIPHPVYQERIAASWASQPSAPGTVVAPIPAERFFYQIGVEKPSAGRQIPLPFTESAPAVTNSPPPPGQQVGPAVDRNPIAEALDTQ